MRSNEQQSAWFKYGWVSVIFVFLVFLGGSQQGVYGVVVSSVAELETAVENTMSGGDKEIILEPGTYILNDALGIWADGVTIRSQSGNRGSVIIRGEGMSGGVSHIFNVPGSDFTARDMTIGWVANHAVQIWGNNSSSNTRLINLRIVDCNEQMVKISYDAGNSNYSANGVMENCLLEYSAGIGPQYYIGGIDGHRCRNWIVRNNIFKYISSPSDGVAEHAIHFWSDSQDTLVENNQIIDCDRGIGFGLGDRGHINGIIRNNMIYHSETDHGFADVPIGLENCSNAQVYNNTVYLANTYPNAIEYRFVGTSGCTIANNLCNKAIVSRDGGSATLSSNITTALSSWFTNIGVGNLHLVYAVPGVVNQGVAITGLVRDFDGDLRPQGSGIDIGADEYVTGGVAGILVTSPNGGESWVAGSTHAITWSSTGTVGNVKIEYSATNGSSWTTVIASTGNDGSYTWLIPVVSSSKCLVRVKEAGDGTPVDTSNGVFTIEPAAQSQPRISLSRESLFFGGTTGGIVTGSQFFYIENSGEGTLNWSAKATSESGGKWLACSPGSGKGSGVVTVWVDISGLGVGQYRGQILISDSQADNSPQGVAVELTVYEGGSSAGPVGKFETPVHGSTVCSSIPVTGWVIDDIEVVAVEIYCDTTYIGDGIFVEGARPDVENAYPGYPQNNRSGWGYMLLTNYLPDGGNGTYWLWVRAIDVEGHVVMLGENRIVVDNVHAFKPFGAIDTPEQGGIASGVEFINWGWVLTPYPNLINTEGTSIEVFVDGKLLGNPVYGIYRKDVAGYFPSCLNSGGAGGYYNLDTTKYKNGVHTIQWVAMDSAGNEDGIGSRFFTVQNIEGSSRSREKNKEGEKYTDKLPGYREIVKSISKREKVETRELERVVIRLGEGDRGSNEKNNEVVEVVKRGYLVAGENLKPLPIGSSLDRENGIFYWSLGPGFVGTYELIFEVNGWGYTHWEMITIKIHPHSQRK